MQGRLVPPENDSIQCFPRAGWEREFAAAAEAGLDAIEWIYDSFGEDVNPLASDAGTGRIAALSRENAVAVRSICADWFMEHPLLGGDSGHRAAWLAKLRWLIERGQELGATRMVLPFVDAAAIGSCEDRDEVVRALEASLPHAERAGMELHLETSLGPSEFRELLDRIPHPLVRANYDSGNSASLGYAAADELAAYGERIGSVHIKDRKRGGGTVPLGTGDADIDGVLRGLRALDYRGDFILQVARGATGQEVSWARQNREYFERLWKEAAG
jgi:hexulose-6-phosphate isomerase